MRWVLLSPGLGCWDQRNSQTLVQGSILCRWPAHTGYLLASSVSPGSTLSFHIENALQMRICPHLAPVGWRKILLSAVLNILTLVKFSVTYGTRDSREPFSPAVSRRADGKHFKPGENPSSLSKGVNRGVGLVKM